MFNYHRRDLDTIIFPSFSHQDYYVPKYSSKGKKGKKLGRKVDCHIGKVFCEVLKIFELAH